MEYVYAISIITENGMRVLQRIAGIFSRYRINIEHINAFEVGHEEYSYLSIIVHSNENNFQRLLDQLHKIVEIKEVNINHRIPSRTKPSH